MPVCIVKLCKNNSTRNKKDSGITYHLFPSNPIKCAEWTSIVARERRDHFYKPAQNSVICSDHFDKSDISGNTNRRRLAKTAVPKLQIQLPLEDPQFAAPSPKVSVPDFEEHNEDSDDSLADEVTEIKVFCPKCKAEVSHTAEGIQEDQTKILIAKVYHYFEQEYEELKKSFDGLEQTPLSKFRQRTALATGVSETTVAQILQEEERRQQRDETRRNERLARKRAKQTYTSSEEDSDNDDDDKETSSTGHVKETVVVKEEPPESYNEPELQVSEVKTEPGVFGANDALADPISIELKTDPQNEEATASKDTLAIKHDTKRNIRRRKKRNTEGSSDVSAPPGTTAPPTPNAPPRRLLLLLEDGDIKMEQSETEEGFS